MSAPIMGKPGKPDKPQWKNAQKCWHWFVAIRQRSKLAVDARGCLNLSRHHGQNPRGVFLRSKLDVPEPNDRPLDAAEVAGWLAEKLEQEGCDYALGGAIALAFWAVPRGTVDVDVAIYLPVDDPSQTIRLLQKIGALVEDGRTRTMLQEHGFCRAEFMNRRVDIFLPIAPFYQVALPRRKRVTLGQKSAMIWDAETLCVFKMMFFRRKDLADVESVLVTQGEFFDTGWVEKQLIEIYGKQDPRVPQWNDLVHETRPKS